ncbi:MAG: ABC transporter ATP-binding protein [Chloroflexi bacterium]|nr:ABC transporter ATP-binding protein [Chloroflexota bacterium]
MSIQPPPVAAEAPYAIDVADLGVQYDLRFNRKTTVRQSIANLVTRKPPPRFWALRHVDLRLVRGESLAVIGPNGAGKSTLLQVLAGIMRPTEGRVDVRGKISGLLGLGAAFDAELSGIENILLGGAFLGVEDARIRELLPSIVDFADLGQFIDAPIKTYSSGMRARLGFSIATSVDPDILLLDEVLATGDASFREKSKARVIELVRSAKAVVLVTHDMAWVKEYCNRAILLEKGRLVSEGSPADVVEMHLEHAAAAAAAREAAKLAGGLDPRVEDDRRRERRERRRRRRMEMVED